VTFFAAEIGGKSSGGKKPGYGTGRETLRLRTKGTTATVEVVCSHRNTLFMLEAFTYNLGS